MSVCAPERLQRAVVSLYPDIEERVRLNQRTRSETDLWRELSCCLLSSQVPYGLAQAAAEAIESNGLLTQSRVAPTEIEAILSAPMRVAGQERHYRFPASRAVQLAATHARVMEEARGLQALLDKLGSADEARRWFVLYALGFGPKQASMFLRNIGITYELAVLDRHVLRYMYAVGLQDGPPWSVGTIADYRRCEQVLVDHARMLGFRVGLLDWAIWIVARAARSLRLEVLPG